MTLCRASVLGAGTMGHALALVHAIGGCSVRLTDSNSDTLNVALSRIRAACDTLIDAGAMSAKAGVVALDRIEICSTLEETVFDAELVVEAVVENATVKQTLFTEVDRAAPVDAIFSSNSSYLDVFPLMPRDRRARAVIAHWYTPPYIIDLVDLVPSSVVLPEVLIEMRQLYEGFGKTVLLFDKLIPGFIANRLQSALNLECLRMIDEGLASAEQIDLAVKEGLAARLAVLGHMRKADFTGLEMLRNGLRARMYDPPPVTGRSPTVDRLIAEGRTGVAAGAGFFDYGTVPPDHMFRVRDQKLLKFKAAMAAIEAEYLAS